MPLTPAGLKLRVFSDRDIIYTCLRTLTKELFNPQSGFRFPNNGTHALLELLYGLLPCLNGLQLGGIGATSRGRWKKAEKFGRKLGGPMMNGMRPNLQAPLRWNGSTVSTLVLYFNTNHDLKLHWEPELSRGRKNMGKEWRKKQI